MIEICYYYDKPIESNLILDTFQKSYGKEMDFKTFEWRFLNNPFAGKVYINYIKSNDILAAYYAVSPVKIWIDGQSFLIALSNMTMTHPEHQGKGYFKLLANDLYSKLKEDGFIGVFGFANQNSHYGFRKNLEWIDLAGLNGFSLDGKDFNTALVKNNKEFIFEDSQINISHIQKADKLRCSNQMIIPDRSEIFLSWRLKYHPTNKYQALLIETKNDLRGILFYKFYNGSIDIMEYFYNISDEFATFDTLINGISFLLNKYSFNVNIWSNLHSDEHLILEKFGFKENNFLTYFGVIPFTHKKELMEIKNWHYRFIDSDIF
jgi:hypothetical protein